MNYLSLVVEFHHPLPGPGEPVGRDWAVSAVETYWPLLRTISDLSDQRLAAGLVVAISPSWSALASDPAARDRMGAELERRAVASAHFRELRRFVERCDADPLALLRRLRDLWAIDVVPTTASPTWLPSVACVPLLAKAQIRLAACDHARRLGTRAEGIWLPFLSYLPGIESVMADSGIRYFGVAAGAFLRGTTLPPYGLDNPLITPPGVAAFAVRSHLEALVADPARRYARDPRYQDSGQAHAAAAEHAAHFLTEWRDVEKGGPAASRQGGHCVAALSAHDLGGSWRGGPIWLAELLRQAGEPSDFRPITLGQYLDRFPEGVLGRPGPSAGGLLSVRPEGSSLLDRCRAASETLADALEHARLGRPLARRCVAQMIRSLLLAQRLDWSAIPGRELSPAAAIERAERHLRQFHELAGSFASGLIDPPRLAHHEAGPPYLPEIDLDELD